MIEWGEQHLAIRDAFRRFVDSEIKPRREELEHGDTPPYEVLRKMFAAFGLRDMSLMRYEADLAKADLKTGDDAEPKEGRVNPMAGEMAAMQMIPIIELSKHSPAWSRRWVSAPA